MLVAGGSGQAGADLAGYRLRAGSPALGAGTALPQLGDRDCFGNAVPAAAPNIGAYQGPDALARVEIAVERGLRVPDDLAIVAYDDEIAALAHIPLTAVAPPKTELGETAVRKCLERLRRPAGDARGLARATLLPTLVERSSTRGA
ncbi:substrate-binding domain-containing protein [Microbacterium sp. NEAU-LLC]|uniref:Substrate-binding domain-containing protein n=1 Tax=Microbacterium helvum TaxID=2773713 RepID=A0ABR8NP71_9MICO|nr:substrate-binding domain-containing protein [Microbacterium helvum]